MKKIRKIVDLTPPPSFEPLIDIDRIRRSIPPEDLRAIEEALKQFAERRDPPGAEDWEAAARRRMDENLRGVFG